MRVGLKVSFQAAFRKLSNEAQLLEVASIEKLVEDTLFPALRLGCSDTERDDIKMKLVDGSTFENDAVVLSRYIKVCSTHDSVTCLTGGKRAIEIIRGNLRY